MSISERARVKRDGRWTEGVCADGAAILRDGQPVSISELLAILNASEPDRSINKPRSVPQHKRYWAMVNAAFSHWPEVHRFKPMTADRLRKWLQAKAGYATVKTVNTSGMTTPEAVQAIAAELATADPIHFTSASAGNFYIVQSKSIDFDTLPHLEACALFDAVAQVIEAETDLKVDQIMPPISNRLKPKEMHAEVPL